MGKVTLVQAQRLLLGIITNVEIGEITAEDAADELSMLKTDAKLSNVPFKADYTIEDFQRLRENYDAGYSSSSSSSSY